MATLENLPNHCSNNNCNWCKERRNRRRAQAIADSIALAKPSTTFDYWNRPITRGNKTLGLTSTQPQTLTFNGTGGIRYLKTDRNTQHKLVGGRK